MQIYAKVARICEAYLPRIESQENERFDIIKFYFQFSIFCKFSSDGNRSSTHYTCLQGIWYKGK